MTVSSIQTVHAQLREQGIPFEEGLTAAEISGFETLYTLVFPPDLREFLSYGLPVSEGFPNWRTGEYVDLKGRTTIAEMLDWPAKGICFDIEHNDFWMSEWGPKPSDLHAAFKLARLHVKQAPGLVPIFSHRYLPTEPFDVGNPVLSVWQTDIIYYGADLISYFAEEFDLPAEHCRSSEKEPRRIRFWSDVIDVSWNHGNPRQGRAHKN